MEPLSEALDPGTLEESVADIASRTSVDVRLHVNEKLLPFERLRSRAIRHFFRLDLHDAPCGGLLIMVSRETGGLEIVTSGVVTRLIPEDDWAELVRRNLTLPRTLPQAIRELLQQVGELLESKFPRRIGEFVRPQRRVSMDSDD
jgi:uncharacterized membrane protein